MTLENRGSNFAWQVSDRLVDFGSAMTENDAGDFRLIIIIMEKGEHPAKSANKLRYIVSPCLIQTNANV